MREFLKIAEVLVLRNFRSEIYTFRKEMLPKMLPQKKEPEKYCIFGLF